MTKFDRDTAVTHVGGGKFAAEVATGWRAVGPNGGYIAALVMRALAEASAAEGGAGEPRYPRSLTVHYLAPPHEGPVEIETSIDKLGKTVTFVSGRMIQDGRTTGLARAVFATMREGPEFADLSPPPVLSLVDSLVRPDDSPMMLPEISARFDTRMGYGGLPFSQASEAVTGGWIRYVEDRPLDCFMIAALSDAWWPAIFARTQQGVSVPTLDLTVHFRVAHPEEFVGPSEHCMAVFRSGTSAEGFVEEDGEIWSPGGKLLAQSRQLALARFM